MDALSAVVQALHTRYERGHSGSIGFERARGVFASLDTIGVNV